MRGLRSVGQPGVASVVRSRHDALDGGHIPAQLVGDDHSWLDAIVALQHAVQESLGSVLVAAGLDQDVQHRPILAHRAPQPIPTLVQRERDVIEAPPCRHVVASDADAPS
jgi:hypothetical protein